MQPTEALRDKGRLVIHLEELAKLADIRKSEYFTAVVRAAIWHLKGEKQ